MARLIDADAFVEAIKKDLRKHPEDDLIYPVMEWFLENIKGRPTIEQPTWISCEERLTIKERANVERICRMIEQKCRDMMQPGMWERYTRHMECGEIREFAQYYRDMETVYKALTGVELFPQPPKGDE